MPPVQITRAEYEKKFGVKPVVQTDVELDTTPAPVRITRAEYDEMFNPPVKTTGQNIKQDIQETKQGISNTLAEGSQLRAESRNRFMQGEISAPKTIFQQGGQMINTGFGVAMEALKGAAKTLTSESVEKGATNFLKGFMERGANYNDNFVADTMATGKPEEKEALQNILDTKQLYETDPNFKADVDAAGGFASLIYLPSASKKVASKVVEGTSELIDTATPPATKLVEEIKQRIVPTQEKRVASQANDILKVEEKYQTSRNANIREGAGADASRQRIAQSNVLEGAVDENGLIDTNEAIKIYRSSTIDGDEDKVRVLLKEEGKTANLNEIRNELRAGVLESGLEGAALTKAIQGIENHIKGLAIRADAFGDVPLYKLQDAKIAEYQGINYGKPNTAKYKKTIARVYKEVIENKSGQDIKAINAELSKFYQDIERLERLNGKRVEGGRLGKYGAQVVGSVVGAAGGSVAGGAGAFVGGVVGGELASKLKGKAMAGTFSRGIDAKAPDNSILKNAKTKIDLKTPSPKVGVPASIKATPEMKKVEAQISRNVDLQKKAIKAGDFGLVAELKDIYENLVAKLKILIADQKKPAVTADKKQGKVITNIKKVFIKENTLNKAKQDLDNILNERDILKTTLDTNPAKKLQKYMARGDNSLAQIQKNNEGTDAKSALLDDIVTELGYKDLGDAQNAIDSYRNGKERLLDLDESIKEQKQFIKKLEKSTQDEIDRVKPKETIENDDVF